MIERLVGGVNMKGIAWRVFTLVIVFFGLVGFADFIIGFLERVIPFVPFGAYTVLGWVFVIYGIVWFYKKTK